MVELQGVRYAVAMHLLATLPRRNLGPAIATLREHERTLKSAIGFPCSPASDRLMPADIINLRRARKARTRTAREREAAEKRERFGRSKSERLKATSERERAERLVEGHRREPKD